MFWTLNRVLGASGLLVALLLAGLFATRAQLHFARVKYDGLTSSYQAEIAAHKQTVLNYRTAALAAQADAALNKRRAEAQQSTINDKVAQDYETRISDIRARFAVLVRKSSGAEADPDSSASAPVPSIPDASAKPDETAKSDKISPAMTLEEQRDAEEQAEQLLALQIWVKEQAAIDRNGEKQ